MYFKLSTTFQLFLEPPISAVVAPLFLLGKFLPVQYGVLREASRGEAGLGSSRCVSKTFDSEDMGRCGW